MTDGKITDFHDDDDVLTMIAKLAYKSNRDGNIDPRIVRHVENPNHRPAPVIDNAGAGGSTLPRLR